jgi:XTP/dITP diphosphohydrolase
MKKFNKILIGTHNKGKFKELSFLLSKNIKKVSPNRFNIKSPREYGKTFKENSEIKARYFYKNSKIISISDDSGLAVDYLKGAPGIYSSRWAKKCGGFHQAMKKIISLVKDRNTKAKFICSLTVQLKNKKLTTKGVIHGNIAKKILGKNGFGYDSIFIPQRSKKTFGQMSKKKKMLMDHRYIAFKKMKKKINFL